MHVNEYPWNLARSNTPGSEEKTVIRVKPYQSFCSLLMLKCQALTRSSSRKRDSSSPLSVKQLQFIGLEPCYDAQPTIARRLKP